MDTSARVMGLEINQDKTMYMICGARKKYCEHMLKVKHMIFEGVNSFVYLGSLITDKNMSRKHKVTIDNGLGVWGGNLGYE